MPRVPRGAGIALCCWRCAVAACAALRCTSPCVHGVVGAAMVPITLRCSRCAAAAAAARGPRAGDAPSPRAPRGDANHLVLLTMHRRCGCRAGRPIALCCWRCAVDAVAARERESPCVDDDNVRQRDGQYWFALSHVIVRKTSTIGRNGAFVQCQQLVCIGYTIGGASLSGSGLNVGHEIV